jgi:CBS domain-containing protein
MSLTAADVMQTRIVAVAPSDLLRSVQRLFFEEEIHGAPVISEDGHVIGIVTSTDLARAALGDEEPRLSEEELEDETTADLAEELYERISGAVVSDCMTESPVCVAPEAPISEVARCMRESRVHRVLVVKGGLLRGIVSAVDLLGAVEKQL